MSSERWFQNGGFGNGGFGYWVLAGLLTRITSESSTISPQVPSFYRTFAPDDNMGFAPIRTPLLHAPDSHASSQESVMAFLEDSTFGNHADLKCLHEQDTN
jgi:hypothetical protein